MLKQSFAIAAVLAVSFGPTRAAAQGGGPHLPPTFGVLAGANLSKLGGKDASGLKTRTGFVGGVFGVFHANEFLGFEPEVLYSQKGAKASSGGVTGTFKLDYVEVPLLARLDIPVTGSAEPFFVLGPAFGFQVKCEAEGTSGGVTATASCSSLDIPNKKFDMSGTVGAGVGFKAGKQTLSVSVRYTHGFTDVFSNSDAKNRTWSFLGGIAF